jgi:type IV secretory pathway component VirB8
MSVVEQLHSTAVSVEGVRDGLGRLRGALEQTESVLDVADDVLGKADEVLESAAEALETSKRWAPRVALVLGVVTVAAIGVVVIMRLRQRDDD